MNHLKPRLPVVMATAALIIAAVAGILAGIDENATAITISNPGALSIEGSSVCAGPATAGDPLIFNSGQWCGGIPNAVGIQFLDNVAARHGLIQENASNWLQFCPGANCSGIATSAPLTLFSTLSWNSGTDITETNGPRFVVTADDEPGVLTDATENFGSYAAPVAVTVRSTVVYTEVAAASCTTKPVYKLCTGATYNTCTTSIITGCTPVSGTAIGQTSCAATVTSVPASNFIWWTTTTAAATCAAKFHLQYDMTTN